MNPLTGRWVTIVAERAQRPSDFAPRSHQVEADPSRPCPFCPGNEDLAMPPTLQTAESSGTVVQGNYVGTNEVGTLDLGNTMDGVVIGNGATNNLIKSKFG